jgi:hypothetical protein
MPLPLPNLDTRRWNDLVEEARAQIPRYAPAWTDHNVHDPGITLIDLLAWLVEQDIYNLNRVPESHRRKFLALVGARPRGPRPSIGALGLAPPVPVDVPVGLDFEATTPEGQTMLFRSVETLHAVPTALGSVLVQTTADAPPLDQTRIWREHGVSALGDDPVIGAALWLGFDRPLAVDQYTRLTFLFAGGRSGADERARIVDEADAQRAACVRPLPSRPDCAEAPSPTSDPGAEPLEHHSARLTWDFRTATGTWRRLEPDRVRDETRALTLDGPISMRLPEAMGAMDAGTGQTLFYLRARLEASEYDAPPSLADVVVNAATAEQALPVSHPYVIGAGAVADPEAPGVLPWPDGVELEPRTVRVKLQLDSAGAISSLAFVDDEDAPEVRVRYYQPAGPAVPGPSTPGLIVLDLLFLGRSSGLPTQVFALPRAAVVQGSLELYTLEPPDAPPSGVTWQAWQPAPDFDAATGRDACYVVDEAAATVTLGDGNHGRIPRAGTPIFARYRSTAGAAGDVSGGRIATLAPTLTNWLALDPQDFRAKLQAVGAEKLLVADPGHVWSAFSASSYEVWADRLGPVANPHLTVGGADAERIATATGRAVAALEVPTRAATIDDYELLARSTPGTAIARVCALAGRHPSYPCLAAPGVVTIIVVPAQRRARPMPSRGLLDMVRRYLNRRRVLGTHVEVVGPNYLTVQVIGRVAARPGASPTRVRTDIITALDRFLHPLTGSPAATARDTALVPREGGWPFGRDVYRAEILQVIDGVAGVDYVLGLELSGDGGPGQCGNLCVGPTQLVVSGQHVIEVV